MLYEGVLKYSNLVGSDGKPNRVVYFGRPDGRPRREKGMGV